ncbi:MAG: hypothetical protein H7Z37_14240 [Pyrinomonadaceae bacterium]|nr:hypothetical protein [Pyrinomonadaceae bacterium]
MKKTNRTFSQILTQVAANNMQTLMTRARTANRLAKTSTVSGAKARAYQVKVHALEGLKQNFPDKVKIQRDWRCGPRFVLVRIAERRFGLHAPAKIFGL